MDANECNTSHLDADVRLPPRKRLLAGLKKQSCSESNSPCSHENYPSPSPISSPSSRASPLSEFDVRLNYLLKSYKNGSNMSPEEIAKAAKLAAEAAVKAAEAAKVTAEEKAAIAVKAVSAAKTALDLVASVSNDTGSKEKHPKNNKLKKHVPVQLLYKKYQPVEDNENNDDLARKLHSPRSDSKNKLKKLKFSPPSEKNGVANGTSVVGENSKLPSACIGDIIEGGINCGVSKKKPFTVEVDNKVSKSSKPDELEVGSAETKSCELMDDVCINGRKRGRIKQKKLSLSICSSKDQSNPKEDQNLTNSLLNRARIDKPIDQHVALVSELPAERTSRGSPNVELQGQVSQYLKLDKVVQS